MKSGLFNCILILGAALTVTCGAVAQQKSATGSASEYGAKGALKPLPPGGPAPRLADGHPDLSGIWFIGSLGKEDATLVGSQVREGDPALRAFDPKVTPEEKPSFQPWAADKIRQQQQANVLSYSPASFNKLPKEQKLAGIDQEIAKLSRTCMPAGVPRIGLGGGHGMELVQHPGVLVQLIDANHDFRVIPTDGRPHSKDPAPAFNGEEVGHWDGDTLVIDTIGIDERVWNNDQWTFHSEQEHVVERFTRPSLNYLIYQATIDDPMVLTKPWTSAPHRWSLSVSHEQLDEWYCGVSNNDEVTALKETRKRLEEEK